MKQSLVQSVWFVFLLILAFVPIFGILPGVYLLVTSQHAANLQPMKAVDWKPKPSESTAALLVGLSLRYFLKSAD